MKATAVRLVQQALVAEGLSPGKIDGRLGPKTYDAVAAALAKRSAELPAGWREWSNRRRCVAMLQLLCKAQEIAVGRIDGLWGPQTEYAYDMLAYHHEHGRLPPPFRDETPLDVNPNGWPRQTEAELIRYYGEIGKNQTMLTLPYPHRLAWDLRKTVKKFSCHEKVHDSALRVLQRVLSHYGPERITELRLDRWAGCLNERKMRGGNRWSLHAWGIAIDYDSEFNGYNWGRDRATLAQPEYDPWWRFWEEEGWVSLGRTRNFDWMHVQAAKL
ncbi:MAG: hypothetical protein LJE63_13390 [Desulfobacteraceae bacterium]|jgi:hypothetical protein|nr:hypothetical protein [Desulfobacteraceae bacterium]